MIFSDEAAKGIMKAVGQSVLIIVATFGAYHIIPPVSGYTIAYWKLLIFFLVTIYVLLNLKTCLDLLNGLGDKFQSLPLTSVPVFGWFARKWDEKENREAARRTVDPDVDNIPGKGLRIVRPDPPLFPDGINSRVHRKPPGA